MNKKQKEEIVRKWLEYNGAASFDLKEKNIILHDGGIFSIEVKKRFMKEHTRFVPIKTKKGKVYKMVYYGKKKSYNNYDAIVWMEELDEIIDYFKSMRKMLKKIGIDTSRSKVWEKKLATTFKRGV